MLVDDLLPVSKSTGKLIYARLRNENEWWVPLIEKAYAKLHGSYEALEGGNTADAMVDLTGGVCEQIDLTTPEGKRVLSDRCLWRKFKRARARSQLMACSFKTMGVSLTGMMSATEQGIILGHAYSILDVRHVKPSTLSFKKYRLLQVRNPW